jgi:mRNA-degrading endonuclease YafQ of YafQ-DinJ toxin-antitoxin module
MWRVLFTEKCELEIRKSLKERRLSDDDLRIIGSWIRTIQMNGPEALPKQKIWNDHALEGEWEGCRSSAYSPSGRIIYKVDDGRIIVIVVRITPNHDYRGRNEKD